MRTPPLIDLFALEQSILELIGMEGSNALLILSWMIEYRSIHLNEVIYGGICVDYTDMQELILRGVVRVGIDERGSVYTLTDGALVVLEKIAREWG